MSRKKQDRKNSGGVAADMLRSFIERIERVDGEIADLRDDRKEIFAEAKGTGFDTGTMRDILRLRKMEKADREEREALLDLYKAALGMLDDDGIGAAAARRLSPDPEPAPEAGESVADAARRRAAGFPDPATARNAPKPGESGQEAPPAEPEPPQPTVADARAMGSADALNGDPVSKNPFPPRDARRAAYDEAWCQASGSDGMDLPAAWRRTPKKKPAEETEPEPPAPAGPDEDDEGTDE